jgi:K+-sensing histidine kinase KdpD
LCHNLLLILLKTTERALYITDRTYEQMKSSGDLRLIRNKHVASDISPYYYSAIDLKKYNYAAFTWGSDHEKEMGKIFDTELLLKIVKMNKEQPAIPADLLTEDRITLNELATSAQYSYGAFLLAEKIGNERIVATRHKVILTIMDNGNGIPQKLIQKIFQPFFTTKPTGQGTGLGLSLSYDKVKAHGGEIKVVTKEGERSEFIVELPFK